MAPKCAIIKLPLFYRETEHFLDFYKTSLIVPAELQDLAKKLSEEGLSPDFFDLNIKICKTEESLEKYGFSKEDLKETFFSSGFLKVSIDQIIQDLNLSQYQILFFSLGENQRNDLHLIFFNVLLLRLNILFRQKIVIGGVENSLSRFLNGFKEAPFDLLLVGNGIIFPGKFQDALSMILSLEKEKKVLRTDGYGNFLFNTSPNLLKLSDYCFQRTYPLKNGEEYEKWQNHAKTNPFVLYPVRFLKGCPNKCAFCVSSGGKKEILTLKPSEIVRGLKKLRTEFGICDFFFLHDTLNFSNSFLEELLDRIISEELEIQFLDCLRPQNLSFKMLKKLRKAGCIRIIFGFESGSAKIQRYVKKNLDLSEVERLLKWSCEAGLFTGLEIIAGLPYETAKDIKETINFLKKNRDYIDRIYYNTFNLRRNSLFYEKPADFGIEIIEKLELTGMYGKEEGKCNYNFVDLGFNEINGLKFEEKRKQIFDSHKLHSHSVPAMVLPEFEEEHILLSLYRVFKERITVKRIFEEIFLSNFTNLDI